MDRVEIQTYHQRHGGLPGETATLVDDARVTELEAQEAEHEVVLCFSLAAPLRQLKENDRDSDDQLLKWDSVPVTRRSSSGTGADG